MIERAIVMRNLTEIASDIQEHWEKPYFGAVPYIEAMSTLEKVDDSYYYDSGRSIVNYFLSNAATWRGHDAKRIKAELKALLKG